MLSISDSPSPELQTEKPKTPYQFLHRKNSFNSAGFSSVLHSRTWILITILLLQVLILFTLRSFHISPSLSLSISHRRNHLKSTFSATDVVETPTSVSSATDDVETPSTYVSDEFDDCGSGRIFVYELPRFFNQEILENCDDLNPWSSRCDAMENNGFGQPADSLSGIIPENLVPAWFWTDQFVSEIVFHNRILKHKCRVSEPESATAFYIPFYSGLAVGKYLWSKSSAEERDHHCEMMLKWVQEQPHFKKSYGWDHFITMGRITWDFRRSKDEDWGSRCIYMPGMRNITRLLIERNPWDYFDVGVPYPTGFHPRSQSDILEWQNFVRTRNRTSLFCFAGAKRGEINNDFRGLLLSHCRNELDSCRVVDCGGTRCANGTSAILETFLGSEFCLQPRGDSFTRRSIFDCMVAGSIPVFFWKRTAYFQYEWFLPGEPDSYSVFIDRNGVKNGTISMRSVLERYSKEEVRKMREKVIDYIPKLVYAQPMEGLGDVKDAFDVAIEGVLRRFKEQEEWGFKW